MISNRAATIPQGIAAAARLWPDKVWLDFSGDTWTYARADAELNRLAHGLAALGVRKGDRVCAVLDNHGDMAMLWVAVSKLGAVFVPINTAFRGTFLSHQIADAASVVVVAEAEYVERLVAIADGIPETRTVLYRGPLDIPKTRLELVPFETAYASNNAPPDVEVTARDLAMLLYTSGTTGPSKGCMISHNYICNMGWQSNRHIGVGHDDTYWTPCPLFHIGAAGSIVGTLQVGATSSIYPRFSLSAFWPEIERSRASVVMLLSSMLNFVADAPDTDVAKRCYGQIRVIHGTPFSTILEKQWKERFGVKNAGAVGYGMTEACSITLRFLDKPVPAHASGHRFEDFDVEIVDNNDCILAPGVEGEVVCRPRKPNVMFDGYWRRPEATVDVYRNLWFHTGDIGRIDENGFFYWIDRKKDYLRRGGENISSYELEVTFRGHPDIADVAVHAVAADGAEDEVKVTALLHPGATVSEEVLCRWSLDKLPSFAVPRYIEFRTEFPRNGTGKILKYELRKEGVTKTTWDRAKSSVVVGKAKRAK